MIITRAGIYAGSYLALAIVFLHGLDLWAAPLEGERLGRVGSLQRVATTVEAAIDLHRLATIELDAAARKTIEAAAADGTTPSTPVPQAATEVFARIWQSLGARLAEDTLPAVARAYNAEAIDALARLARAEQLGEVRAPLRAYVDALARLLGQADDIVDVFSRARPARMRVIDPDTALDDIDEALTELARAERLVARRRGGGKPLADQLSDFMRLEIALGRVLDLIAEAEEVGVHIGFEAEVPTKSLIATTAAARARLARLDAAARRMQEAPAALSGSLTVLMIAKSDEAKAEARLAWPAPSPASAPSVLRVYLQEDRAESVDFLTRLFVCETGDEAAAKARAKEQLGALGAERTLIAELAPGRSSLSGELEDVGPGLVPPRYSLVPVSAFGVEGGGLTVRATLLPRTTEPVFATSAALAATSSSSPSFYRDGDRVRVRFSPSRSELYAEPRARELIEAWVEELALPVAKRYRVLRRTDEGDVLVREVPAGTHEIDDRPSHAALARGVSYLVEAVTDAGTATPVNVCKKAEVRADVVAAFALAREGAGSVTHPTRLEREVTEKLRDESALAAALEAFFARAAAEREALWLAFWTSLERKERERLLRAWPSYVPKPERGRWLLQAVDKLAARDRPWVMTELWLLVQPPWMQREIDRWWDLLDESSRQRALAAYLASLDADHRRYVQAHKDGLEVDALRPVRVLAFWRSRDAVEQENIERWFDEVGKEERARLYAAWLEDQAPVAKLSLRWPELERLTPSERERLLARGEPELPRLLAPRFLAWLTWQERLRASGDELLRGELSARQRLMAKARYVLRPLDVALGFRLRELGAAVLLSIGVVLFLRRKRRANVAREGRGGDHER